MNVALEFSPSAFKHSVSEADYWDDYFTKNPPKVTGEGKGFFVKHRGNVVILDDLSATYLENSGSLPVIAPLVAPK